VSIIAIDMGGTVIKAGLVEAGRVARRDQIEGRSEEGVAQAMPRLAALIRSLGLEGVTGVGLALPTLVDVRTGRVMMTMKGKYDGLHELDLPAWSMREFGLPLKLENDVHAAILGEWRFGAGIDETDLVMFTLGTGIGTSVIINGRPLRGAHAQAGNLGGHFLIDPDGFDCVCGARGCLEAQQHLHALRTLARRDRRFADSPLSRLDPIDYAALFQHAPADPLAGDLLRRSLDLWGLLAVTLVHQFDCRTLIVGGGILKSRDVILPHLQRFLDRACTPWGRVNLLPAALGDDAALLGMAVTLDQPQPYL
jgi:glucokinase